ncbi:MAG: hypothetical protein ACLQVI_06785 [Polyangiaceae bacterium]
MSSVPRVEGHGKARLVPERRARLCGLIAAVGAHSAARSLGIGIVTLERATDAYALLPLSTVRRLDLAIDRLGTSP